VTELTPADTRPLADRIRQWDPSTFVAEDDVHEGTGTIPYTQLLGPEGFTAPIFGIYPATLPPKVSIGHHFHHSSEEVYVILDESAEFTVNGRTSLLQGPAGAPCRLGSSHAIYNPTDRPVRFVVFAVSLEMSGYDAWNLGDDRVGVELDARPTFMHFTLDPSLLVLDEVTGARRRCVVPAPVFVTPWVELEHLLVESGSEVPSRRLDAVEEAYLVIGGEGWVQVEDERQPLQLGDAVPIFLGQRYSLGGGESSSLELLRMEIALDAKRKDEVRRRD
jgi:mannose-6-phosphate isomerase-like protein (cupin superfamily)